MRRLIAWIIVSAWRVALWWLGVEQRGVNNAKRGRAAAEGKHQLTRKGS